MGGEATSSPPSSNLQVFGAMGLFWVPSKSVAW